MTLIKSISGIRGTIGGEAGDNLNPINITKFVLAFAKLTKERQDKEKLKVVIGRDARVSGEMISQLTIAAMVSVGVDVIDLGLATTPTVEMAVIKEQADGGIIISASHNPGNWNALKLLNGDGEFLSDLEGKKLLEIVKKENFNFSSIEGLGQVKKDNNWTEKHIDLITLLELVDQEAIKGAKLKVVVDGINSVGGLAVPKLLKTLGVEAVHEINCEPTGFFSHDAEPLARNLTEVCSAVKEKGAHIGFSVDPDVDRLAVIDENGILFSEEYTLAVVADYILQKKQGNAVSNMSSSQVLKDITLKMGGKYYSSAVGEVNVVEKMKEVEAVIGGEGNGGVIYPELHYGRDALVGIALILSYLAQSGKKYSEILEQYPKYYIAKNKIELNPEIDLENIFTALKEKYSQENISDIDGVKIDFGKKWIHLRKSNTEPIIRIYAESSSPEEAEEMTKNISDIIKTISQKYGN